MLHLSQGMEQYASIQVAGPVTDGLKLLFQQGQPGLWAVGPGAALFAAAVIAVLLPKRPVSNSTLLNQPGLQPVRRQLLEQARDYYQRFRERISAGTATGFEDAEIAFRLAGINRELGDADLPHELYAEACAALAGIHSQNPDDPELLDVYSSALIGRGPSYHQRQQWDEADALFAKAARLRQQLKEILNTEAGRSWLKEQSPTIRKRLHYVDRLIANAIKNRGDVQFDRWNRTPPHAKKDSSWDHQFGQAIERPRRAQAAGGDRRSAAFGGRRPGHPGQTRRTVSGTPSAERRLPRPAAEAARAPTGTRPARNRPASRRPDA